MFFDTTLQVFSLDLATVLPEVDESGQTQGTPHLVLAMVTGIAIPTPEGRQVLPVGVIRVPLGRELAIAKAQELLEAAEALPEPKPESDLAIVHSMEEARQAAEFDQQVRSGAVAESA
jgi:hypothetical protein